LYLLNIPMHQSISFLEQKRGTTEKGGNKSHQQNDHSGRWIYCLNAKRCIL